ncbi:MAG: DNA polymerase II [Chitinivibrionales bacterium]|nr:DNA polymerase II [Chitinivibrionales bacterium]
MEFHDTADCFLLTQAHRDFRGKFEIILHAVTALGASVKITIDNYRPLFFVPRSTPSHLTRFCSERTDRGLRSLEGAAVDCLYFSTWSAYLECARLLRSQGIPLYESDVHPVERYLMERFVKGGFEVRCDYPEKARHLDLHNPHIRGKEVHVPLRVLALDIETNADTGEIYSIAFYGGEHRVFIQGGHGEKTHEITSCSDERDLLRASFDYVHKADPDILIGWNVIDFDLQMLQAACERREIAFRIGRDAVAQVLETGRGEFSRRTARVPGRVILDVPVMLRTHGIAFDEYSLEYIAHQMLGRHKRITATGREKIDEINRLFKEDSDALARYNLEDAVLAKEIFDKAEILPNTVARIKRSGHLLDRPGGSIAAFDYLYLPRLHRAGYVARDVADSGKPAGPLQGGHVMEPQPGLYENVLVCDFRSLYPTIIMTFMIDPLGYRSKAEPRITGPVGPSFAREETILPKIISELMIARAEARKDNNPFLSQAIKILMNSFYGVLGTPSCRFFSRELAETITGTGRYLLKETVRHIEKTTGCNVIYGDTDSLFVLLGPGTEKTAEQTGERIAGEVTSWLRHEIRERFDTFSALELEFETHFRHFFMPTVRGGTQGSKKRYCGLVEKGGEPVLRFKGLESARSDWTALAKEFQHEIYMRVFLQKPVEDYVLSTVRQVRKGACDDRLVYKKRMRKSIGEYTGTLPPHVQAARLLNTPKHVVAYYITVDGPQPVEKRRSPIDYNHYIETQLKPVADSILEWTGLDFDSIVTGRQELGL